MKKIGFFAAAILTAFVFTSCGTKKVDATKWLTSLTDGKIAAQQADKKIILFFSADDSDNLSETLKENLLNKDEFIAAETAKYVLVNLDFSESLYEATQVDENASSADKKAAEAAQKQLEENMNVATYYTVQMSPTFYLLSKEGYVITPLTFDDETTSIEQFDAEIASHSEEITAFEDALAKTTEGSNVDKVEAIDALYAMTDRRFAYLLTPLAKQVLKLDSKNESGLVGKFVFEIAQAEATDAALHNDVEKMVKSFETAAEHKHLDADQKQLMYYYAGYYLANTGSTDYARVRDYIQKSYDTNPESDIASEIQNLIRIIDERINDVSEMNENVQIEGNTDVTVDSAATQTEPAKE
ncbi:MAG: thioredoxin family protein [Treponema sp.]|nr:thioredoxin family protein [Treponema sp.]